MKRDESGWLSESSHKTVSGPYLCAWSKTGSSILRDLTRPRLQSRCVFTSHDTVHDVLRWAYTLEARTVYPTKFNPFHSSPCTDGSLSFLERRAEAALIISKVDRYTRTPQRDLWENVFMRNAEAARAPLTAQDSEKQTFGCRYTNPDFCGKNSLPGVCAFARTDGICMSPPQSWLKRYRQLSAQKATN